MEKLLKDLNDAQRQAVIHTQGASMVLAGAGSGENPCPYLPRGLPDPQRRRSFPYPGITFTNKAAREMKENERAGVVLVVAGRFT